MASADARGGSQRADRELYRRLARAARVTPVRDVLLHIVEVRTMSEKNSDAKPGEKQEKDKGYGESHGYGPGHGGPSGPGDAPAPTENVPAPPKDPSEDPDVDEPLP